jgi:hypothetical protein
VRCQLKLQLGRGPIYRSRRNYSARDPCLPSAGGRRILIQSRRGPPWPSSPGFLTQRLHHQFVANHITLTTLVCSVYSYCDFHLAKSTSSFIPVHSLFIHILPRFLNVQPAWPLSQHSVTTISRLRQSSVPTAAPTAPSLLASQATTIRGGLQSLKPKSRFSPKRLRKQVSQQVTPDLRPKHPNIIANANVRGNSRQDCRL